MSRHRTESVFVPNLIIDNVTLVTRELLEKHRIKALILDVDNTLTRHGSQNVDVSVLNWLSSMKKVGIPMAIVSNNTKKRIEPFANKLGLSFIAMGMKPLTHGFFKACKSLGCKAEQVAVVGDQIYTDVLGGNLSGVFTILVKPFLLENGYGFKLKRRLEKVHIERYNLRACVGSKEKES